ncbi:Chromosome partitioning ATPase, Mrp family, contains Fe-S cluster [Micromonospora echinaurantiaca]|uniref:Chromosome partitioning ATPase, Mrp family, contains Fe-S cluster n=1 Tax=Micromonospora echinaurantiaca TaxID=47857 RepID=A0A1C5J2K1_9ACTN|nr:FxSxx-COOH system tetratricopeptide repeat protein [Micromonospora echinaurantiaca]SCG64256.1 Chromosome partitioning ATPase, Mrp family, contains Fe-S cluster [Micromonospora echinaurantiaca]
MSGSVPEPAAGEPRQGRIITFYSYKGGSGRTMALANTAWILASNGYKVLAIDWDLESPGLHRYFHPFLVDDELRRTEGLIELLQRYSAATVTQESSPSWFEEVSRLDSATMSLNWMFPRGGVLDFLPSGKQDGRYSVKVSKFDWDNFWQRLNGKGFIDALAAGMRRDYDFVLVDSRTGLSDSAGVCTISLPDTVVDCFALNTQGVDGAVSVARSIVRADPSIRIYPVPGRVEPGEQAKLQRGRDYAQRKFRPYTDALELDGDRYWRSVEVPYKPYYAYEEILAIFGDRPSEPNSPLSAFVALAELLADRPLETPDTPEKQRLSVLARFERTATSAPIQVIVQYAAIDRIWAEWISQELIRIGHDCLLVGPGREEAPALEGIDRVVVLLSHDGLTYEGIERYWRREVDRADLRPADFLVPMRVNGPVLPVPASVAGTVDFPNLRADEAVQAVFTALGIRYTPPGSAAGDLSRIRFPAQHTRHWRVPSRRNPAFVGREATIEELRDRLLDLNGSTAVSLIGMSGVGKTQIALEYVYRFAAAYDIVWWISADSVEQVTAGFEALGEVLGLPPNREGTGRVDAVLRALRERDGATRWLVVLDNAEDPGELADLVPTGPGDAIITTRDQAWSRSTGEMQVDVFERAESVALLARRGAKLATSESAVLAERLGDLPAAVETAGYWLASTAGTLPEYLRLLEGHVAEALQVPGYDAPITATFSVAMESLRGRSPAAARLVELLTFFAPNPIPTAILKSERIGSLLAEHDAALRDPLLLSRLIQHIGRFGLIKSDPASRSISMHVLTQQAIRHGLSPDERVVNRGIAQEALADINPGDADNADNWPLYEGLRPHVDALEAVTSNSPNVRKLIIDLVRYLRLRGYYAGGEQLADRATAAWAELFPDPDDVMTLLLRFQYANIIRDLGRMAEAYGIDNDLMERFTRVAGEDHPYTLMVAGSYAQDLREQGRWAEAEEREAKTFGLIPVVLGEDHPRTLMAALNYALTMRLAGNYAEALRLDRQTLDKRRRLLGERHPFTLSSADAYGTDQRDNGDLQGSRKTLEAAWKACEEVLGEEHPDTLRTLRNFATTLRWLGETRLAASLLDVALPRYERVLGAGHPATVGCRLERANVASDLGEDDVARRLAADAERAYRELFEPAHPLYLVALNNLGVFTRRCGDLSAGRAMAERAAAGFEEVLGATHTITALALVNVANAAHAAGDAEYGRHTDERAYDILRETLRPENIALIGAMLNVAVGRLASGDYDQSGWNDAVAYSAQVLGNDHPITELGRQKRRVDLDIEPFVM